MIGLYSNRCWFIAHIFTNRIWHTTSCDPMIRIVKISITHVKLPFAYEQLLMLVMLARVIAWNVYVHTNVMTPTVVCKANGRDYRQPSLGIIMF